MPKIFKYLPKWWNFAKSGHTGVSSPVLKLKELGKMKIEIEPRPFL